MESTSEAAKDIDFRDLAGVGRGIRKAMADDIRMRVGEMPTTPFYQQEGAGVYPFEALDSKAIAEVVKPVVDAWFNVCSFVHSVGILFHCAMLNSTGR